MSNLELEGALIVNTQSRRGAEQFEQARRILQEEGMTLRETFALRDPSRLPEVTRRAIESGIPLVIVGGGDGTLSAVARYFVGRETILGVLPLGTGNQFARDLGIESRIEEACRIIKEGVITRVDVGQVKDDVFLNVVTVGLTEQIARGLTKRGKRKWGRLLYAVALYRAVRKTRAFRAHLETSQGMDTFETNLIVIGNGRYHAGPFPLAPNASITDGKLVAYFLTETSPRYLLQFGWNLVQGSHTKLPFVHTVETEQGCLQTEPLQQVVVDGEILYETPIPFGVLPKALRVLVPANL